MNKKVYNWINKQTKIIEKRAKRNKFLNYILFYSISTINLTVIGLSIWALFILLNFFYQNPNSDLVLQIVMASLAAGCNLFIFIFTILNLLYRSRMKFNVYKDAIDSIQNEYMKFSLKHSKYQESKNPKEKLKKEVKTIFENALSQKTSKVKLTKVITKVIKDGKNA